LWGGGVCFNSLAEGEGSVGSFFSEKRKGGKSLFFPSEKKRETGKPVPCGGRKKGGSYYVKKKKGKEEEA